MAKEKQPVKKLLAMSVLWCVACSPPATSAEPRAAIEAPANDANKVRVSVETLLGQWGAGAYQDHAAVIAATRSTPAMTAAVSIGYLAPDFSFDFDGAFTGVAVARDGRWRFLQGHLSKAETAVAK